MLSLLPLEPTGSTMSMGAFLATKAMSVAEMPSLPTRGPRQEARAGKKRGAEEAEIDD